MLSTRPDRRAVRSALVTAALALMASSALAQQAPARRAGDGVPQPAMREGARLDLAGDTRGARALFQRLIDSAATPAARAEADRAMAMSYAFDGDCGNTLKYEQRVIDYWKTRERAEPQNAFFQEGEIANEGARVCIDAGALAAAERWYRMGYALGMKEPEPRTHPKSLWDFRLAHALGRIAARRGNRAEAQRQIAAARRALAGDTAMAAQQERFLPYLVGYVALYTGDLRTAQTEFTKAVSLRGNERDPFMQCLLAETDERLGHAQEAASRYRQAWALAGAHNPPSAYVRRIVSHKLDAAALAEAERDGRLDSQVDSIAAAVLAATGAPSASVAVVRGGRLVLARAYGAAQLEPRVPATPAMRYSIGSISKQFAAGAVLLLQQDGKLSLDDKVAKYIPDLTRAGEVTIRQLLSHTSGYQDYWPQDYMPPDMFDSVSARTIVDRWAKKPLDFAPGTQWQYSNTNYVIAGMIVEQVSGMPFFQFVRSRILQPLGMGSVTNVDLGRLPQSDPTGYMRYALGPLRPAPKEGKGWLFAAGELAMTPSDLAKWDIAMIDRSLLAPASYRAMETDVLLANGVATGYGLGVDVGMRAGHRLISHTGEVSGFTAANQVYPDDSAAVVVLTNQDAASAASAIAAGIGQVLFTTEDANTHAREEQARRIFEGLQKGELDRSLFTADANFYFSKEALADFAVGLAPLGTPTGFTQVSQGLRGGMLLRVYRVTFPSRTLRVWTFEMPDGKLEQYQVVAVN